MPVAARLGGMTTAAPPTSPPRTTYAQVLAEPRFRLLFLTRSLAIAADTLRIVALSVVVFAVTGSPLLGAITYGIGFLPQIVGATLFGALADRLRPRRLIVAGYLLECATAATLALARLPVGLCLLLVAGVAALTPVVGGASSRLVAELLTGDAYVLGRSLSSMASSAAQLLGLAGGGVAVATLGARHALLVSAGCHLAAALAVRLRLPDLPGPKPGPARFTVWHSLGGVRRLFADRRVRLLLLAQWLPPAFVTGAESLIVPYASQRGFPAGSAGLLLACVPIGMLAGDLVVGRFVRPATRERLVAPLVAVLGLPLLALAADVAPMAAAGLLAVTGVGFAYGLGIQRRFLEAVPETTRGQAFGLLSSGLMTVQGLGPTVFGAVAEATPVGVAMALAGVSTVLTALVLAVVTLPGRTGPTGRARGDQ
jgi:predicted MFS family arabinose efflux permease